MDLTLLARFGLLLVRPGMLVSVAPGFGGLYIPAPVKVGLTVLIAIALLPSVPLPATGGAILITTAIAREAAIGLSLAFVVRALIAGVEFAGHLSGNQIGFSYGATVDPQSGVRNPMLSTLYGLLATLGFLAINGHHMLLRALVLSYQRMPIGEGRIDASLVAAVREILSLVFIVALRVAAPIVVVLLVVEIALGLISKSAPSLSVQVIGFPVRIIIGLFLLAVIIPTIPSVTNALLESVMTLALRTAAAFR